MTSPAPGTFGRDQNRYYKTQEEFLFALADALRVEYRAITGAGFILQIDDPGMAENWDAMAPSVTLEEYRAYARLCIDALNHAYDVAEWRPWWKRRLVAILLTIALAVFIIIALAFVLAGPSLVSWPARWLPVTPSLSVIWAVSRWPLMILCVVLAVDLIYYFAPNRRAHWVWITPGSLLATGLWIGSSFAFKAYIVNFADYSATYGAIGGAIITMLWFYLSSLAVLIGAELNGVIEHASQSTAA